MASLRKVSSHQDALLVCKELVPGWSTIPDADFKIESVKGGTTNTLLKCEYCGKNDSLPPDFERSVAIRVYGENTDMIIDRSLERKMASFLGSIGRAPRCYGTFPGGVVSAFVPGRSLHMSELYEYAEPIAKELATWHTIDCSIPALDGLSREIAVWKQTEEWIDILAKHVTDPEFTRNCIDVIRAEEVYLKEELSKDNGKGLLPVACLCHNDVAGPNIVFNEEKNTFTFIDFEYANYSSPRFDLGNHFCEYGGLVCDYSRFPDRETQAHFIRPYLRAILGGAREPTEEEVEEECARATRWSLASHFMWGVWSLFLAKMKPSPDFDYIEYAYGRLGAYEHFKRTPEINLCGGCPPGSIESIP